MNPQTEKLLQWFETGRTITSMEAFKELRITRLSARIWDLKAAGYLVKDRWEEEDESRFKRYFISEEDRISTVSSETQGIKKTDKKDKKKKKEKKK